MAEIISEEVLNDNNDENSNNSKTEMPPKQDTKEVLTAACYALIGQALADDIMLAIKEDNPAKTDSLAKDLKPAQLYALATFALHNNTSDISKSVEVLLTLAQRHWQFDAKAAPFGGHGVYMAGAGIGRCGGEIGFVTENKEASDSHTGIGAYLVLEHFQPKKRSNDKL